MRRQGLIAGAVAVLMVAVFFLALYKPLSSKISKTKTETEVAQSEGVNLRLQLQQLQAAKRDAPATLAKLAQFDVLLPPDPSLPTFIRQVQDAADLSGMDLTSIGFSPPAAATGSTTVSSISVTLQVTGGFFRLESFLARLELLQRLVQVQSLSISPSIDQVTGLPTLQSSVTLQMYAMQATVSSSATNPSPTATASPTPSVGASG